MSLRSQLSLFFGGLICLILSAVVWTNYQRLYSSLEQGLEAQFSVAPYLQLAKVERTLLYERASSLVGRVPVLKGLRAVNSLVEREGLEKVKSMRSERGNRTLASLYEQMLTVLNRSDDSEGQDLVVLASNDGMVVAEAFHQSFEQIGNSTGREFDFKVSVENLSDAGFWPILSSFQYARGYLVYPNKKLYFYGMDTFMSWTEPDGVAIVGMEIDRPFLRLITDAESSGESESEETHSIVVYNGGVVASSDLAQKLGEELAKATQNGQEFPSQTWESADGNQFLVKSTALKPFYFSEDELSEFGELPSELRNPPEVGRFYLLRNVSEIRAKAFEGARDTLVLGVAALVFSLMAVSILANRFTEPVGALTEAMKGVGEGKLEPLAESKLSNITEINEAGLSFNQMIIGLRQKKILEHFVPEGTRREIEELQGRTTELGGKRWERTIMFSDLRGFTSMSESMSPDEVMQILNKYLHRMSKAIRVNGGDINEYIGDAILAVFESPDAAIKAAIAMTVELEELHQDKSLPGLSELAQGIGLHTGPLVEGNIGEENRRLKRAVVGDTVNLAARIQDRSRDGSHTCIFLSQSTKDKLTEPVELVHFGDENFKGKAEPVPVWEVVLS